MDQRLPAWLEPRRRWVVSPEQASQTNDRLDRGAADRAPGDHGGEMVLYWMHNAVRGHENPALDVAICWARQNGLPLLIYHGLSENYPYASDRHHAFILQAARDAQHEFAKLGITYAFHLERPGHRGPHLRDLTRRAAVVVTEEMPVQPITGWLERLRSITTTPIAAVDTSCLVPGSVVNQLARQSAAAKGKKHKKAPDPFTRAFAFRDLIADELDQRVDAAYPHLPPDAIEPVHSLAFDGPLGFEPLDLQDADLSALIGMCRIDHTVAPVADTPGGTRAGYARWDRFREHGLPAYANRRNDAADGPAVSRMSAYLHYGMVSPFRIAREAATDGAEKYLDELLIWREMSFHFCSHHHDDLDSLDAVPDWAQQTLVAHASDPRPQTFAWETLARGQTDQPLWNLAQQSLLRHGELHNNIRMTWGKGFLPLTRCPSQALNHCIDLNHRYALDGRSPNSYGGILWCFGQFDRPFQPECDVYGHVRPRSIPEHARRIDSHKFQTWVGRPIAAVVPRVAIVGAGLAGLIAARTLQDHGLDVRLYEKARGPGGRMSTRRGDGSLQFDHGAQYFTVRDDVFARHVRSWLDQGLVAPWLGRIVELADGDVRSEKKGTPRYVGVPGNNSIARHLADGLNLQTQTAIERLDGDGSAWTLVDADGRSHGPFDNVLINAPPPQSAALLRGHTSLVESIESVQMRPCWSLMLQAEFAEPLPYEAAFINGGPLSWIARNDAKPGREKIDAPGHENWMLHASPEWSTEQLEHSSDEITPQLIDAFASVTHRHVREITHAVAHRWRYSIPANPLDVGHLWDAAAGLGACGDWCAGSRVEGAFISGTALAGCLLRHITVDRSACGDFGSP